ncbi:efflux RND transporter periplasmic adaptor subunit [Selenihalanaerobacter shriftii]|uniref:RND family efflux transporter, MFP subunit n=1 Tax=Selenihalanaerobacter shriftii TaxID=142842 RepID=A0A1T4LXX1_9FIRM|nr:efflux RND transporter periplasmic adaptor subunit [Selenihalanaerobacter shriftii]SJZ59593.1 RND family efflux transporter, MFP subunit [Selenihalanaerobacter shriftii]
MKKSYRFKVGLLVLLILTVLLTGCGQQENEEVSNVNSKNIEQVQKDTKSGSQKIEVNVLKIEKEDFKSELEITGTIEGIKEVNTFAETNGKLIDLKVNEEEEIKKGEIIGVLKRDILKAKVEQAKANLEVAQTNLNKINAGARNQELKQAKASVNQAEANYKKANADYKRISKLYKDGATTKERLDTVKTNYMVAKAKLNFAQENLNLIQEGARKEDRIAAKFKLKQAQAALKLTKEKLNNTVVTAPVSGVITDVFIEEGEMVNANKPLAYLVSMNQVLLKADVSTKELSNLAVGQTAYIKVNSYPKEIFKGQISKIGSKVDKQSRTIEVDIIINNPEFKLKSGMFGKGRIILNTWKDVIILPKSVVKSKQQNYIYVVKDDFVVKRKVEVESISKNKYLVTEGLQPGEQVITSNFNQINPGEQIYIRKQGSE